MTTSESIESHLSRFGLNSFRHGQKEVIGTVLSGQDCLCVMPTGGGKSLCYQLPAVVLDGVTLVVSPLIALMKDQVDQLESLGVPVSFINSTLSTSEQNARLDQMAMGQFRLVYVAPERFRSGRFCEAAQAVGVKLLAIDEAHCISEWGHDFRPDYARLGHFRRMLGNPPTLALTATATDRVRRDIIEQLELREPRTFVTGFARPNLFYEVQSPRSERQKPDLLVDFLRRTPGSGIIYASTRKRAQEIGDRIAEETKRRVVVYHAGLLPDQRRAAQEDFMTGRCEVVVATNAFGMGIDKSDVRFVVHYNIPGSLEAYYQEAGRAGRDGKPSHCLMLFHASDRYIQEYFIDSAYPDRGQVQSVYEFLCQCEDGPIEMTQEEIKEALSLPIGSDGIGNCEQLLESAGVLERLVASQNMASVRIDSDLPTLVDLLPKQARMQRKVLQAVERVVGQRRHELVQFNLRDLTFLDDIDQMSVNHALRELCKLQAFTYVAPFRGRAIRIIRRDLPFDKLQIDFEAVEHRKAMEYEKLNRVVRFAMGGTCRQRDILRYFGEQDAESCGHCDNCRKQGLLRPKAETSSGTQTTSPAFSVVDEGSGGTAVGVATHTVASGPDVSKNAAADQVSDEILNIVRIILSGVARAQASLPCGKTLIAQMLCGSGSVKMKKLRFNRLSTFGLLKQLTQPEVALIIDGLIALQCLEQIEPEPFRPIVQLTALGVEVMKGQASLPGELPAPAELLRKLQALFPAKTQSNRVPASDGLPAPSEDDLPDPDVLQSLKQWRNRIGNEAGVPLYCILSNETLTELARQRPTTREQLLTVKGIGPVKVERYGVALLEIMQGFNATATAGETSAEPAPAEPDLADEMDFEDLNSELAGESPDLMVDAAEPPRQPNILVRPSAYWTQRLLQAGFSVDECVAIRGLSREAILAHAREPSKVDCGLHRQ